MVHNLTPVDALTIQPTYTEVLQHVGKLISSTGSDTDIFPDGDAQTVVESYIDQEVSRFLSETSKVTTDFSTDDEKRDAKTAIIYGVASRVLLRRAMQRLDSQDYRLGVQVIIEYIKEDRRFIVERLKDVEGLVDYQDTSEEWS